MDQRTGDEALEGAAETRVVRRRRPLWARIAIYGALGLLALLVVGIGFLWIERRPVARHFIESELESRGVKGSFSLDRVGFRTQEVSNLVIGDPKNPDLTAKFAQIQTRLKLDGSFEVYRIVARGVRLKGKLANGKVRWGEIDKLLPPPSDQPFALPDFAVDISDSSIALATPFGPVGIAVNGSGKLSGGFKGRAALASPGLDLGRCTANGLHANLAVSVVARRPHVKGPVALDRFACPTSNIAIDAPRFDAEATFNEAFTKVDGRGRMASRQMIAGANGLAGFVGDVTYQGPLNNVRGHVKLAAQRSRLATITADRTGLDADYSLGLEAGTFTLVGGFNANSAELAPSMLAGVVDPLAAAKSTPIGPVATGIADAIRRTASNFDAQGRITVVNFPGGGAARVTDANVQGPNGARAQIAGGNGVTYYWPQSALRIDTAIEIGGGGLPSGRVVLRQSGPGAPLSGVANLAPYSAGGQRVSLSPVRFGPGPAGSTQVSTVALLDGSFPNGRVRALRLPISGRLGPGGAFAVGTGCVIVSFDYLKISDLQLNADRVPVCPVGPAIVYQRPNGSAVVNARLPNVSLSGRIGSSPLRVSANTGLVNGKQFAFDNVALRLGKSASPVVIDAGRLSGNFAGPGVNGAFAGARGKIGNVPLLLSDAAGKWSFARGKLVVDAATTVADDNPDPRFYPLRSNDLHFVLDGDLIRANGSLRHPGSGQLVTNVDIRHRLSSGAGHADLDVPGLAFGPDFQPDDLTRLTEGVVALVNGTVTGQARINWSGGGKVTSTGDFATRNMDLAAPFGPVAGLTTNLHFTDLLNLESAPGQVATVASINPGIEVLDGQIRYQILPNNLVKVERGEWPFMGGRLILHKTVLNFGSPSAKRLTFELVGFNAKMFVDSLGFEGIEITGIFDGVLPMIFDESGGRIVGGRLDSRPPGGTLQYHGTRPAGMMPGIVFDLFSDIRYRNMIVRLDGDLAGEFATRLTIEGPALGESRGFIAGMVKRVFSQIPLRLNVNINAPFRALIQMAKAFEDPTQAIAPVMPFPIDSPALKVEVLSTTKREEQTVVDDGTSEPAKQSPPPPGGAK